MQDIINYIGVDQKIKPGRPSTVIKANRRALRRIIKTNQRSNVKEIGVLWRDSIEQKCYYLQRRELKIWI